MTEMISGAPLGPRVTEAVPSDDYRILLTFNNGEKRMFDARRLLDMKPFAPLKNLDFFKLVKVEFGTVAWPRDIDYCPDTLYAESEPVDVFCRTFFDEENLKRIAAAASNLKAGRGVEHELMEDTK